jgi:hypothetical protein
MNPVHEITRSALKRYSDRIPHSGFTMNIRANDWLIAIILECLNFIGIGIAIITNESGSLDPSPSPESLHVDVDTFNINGTNHQGPFEVLLASVKPPESLADRAPLAEGCAATSTVVSCFIRAANPDAGNGIDLDAHACDLIDDVS